MACWRSSRTVSGDLRSPFAPGARRCVGSWARGSLRQPAVVGGLAPSARRRRRPLYRRSVHERDDFLHAWTGRSAAGGTPREIPDGDRGRNGLRVPRARDCLFSGSVSIVLAPRSAIDAARSLCVLAARRRRSTATPRRARRDGRTHFFSQRLGILELGPAREPHLLSRGRVFSIAASTAVLSRGTGDRAGLIRACGGGN